MEDRLSEHQVRGWNAASAAGSLGQGSGERNVVPRKPSWFMHGTYYSFNNLRFRKSQHINDRSAEHVVVSLVPSDMYIVKTIIVMITIITRIILIMLILLILLLIIIVIIILLLLLIIIIIITIMILLLLLLLLLLLILLIIIIIMIILPFEWSLPGTGSPASRRPFESVRLKLLIQVFVETQFPNL